MEHGAGVVVARSVGRLQGRKGLLWAVDIARQMFKAEPDRSTIVVPPNPRHSPLRLRRDRQCAMRARISPQAPRATWASRGQAGRR